MRYEIRQNMKSGKVNVYKADAIEIKTDDHGCYVEGVGSITQMVGFKQEGKSRKTWVHPVFTQVEITDTTNGKVTILKSCKEILEEMGRHDLVAKWFA